MNRDPALALVQPFYDALNRPGTKAVAALVESVTTDDWRSFAGPDLVKDRAAFIGQVVGFGKAIPDLAWAIEEVIVGEDRIVVRSVATGTPAGELFGVPHGGRSFRIMTIDVHTVRDGRLAVAHHVEDWATAMRQLAGR